MKPGTELIEKGAGVHQGISHVRRCDHLLPIMLLVFGACLLLFLVAAVTIDDECLMQTDAFAQLNSLERFTDLSEELFSLDRNLHELISNKDCATLRRYSVEVWLRRHGGITINVTTPSDSNHTPT